jgi:hypothetical protein
MSGGTAPSFWTLTLDGGGQFHALTAIPPGERAHGTHWIGGWVGPRVSLGSVDENNMKMNGLLLQKHSTCNMFQPR